MKQGQEIMQNLSLFASERIMSFGLPQASIPPELILIHGVFV